MTGHFLSGIWPRLVSNRDRAGATRGYVWSHDSYTVSQNSVGSYGIVLVICLFRFCAYVLLMKDTGKARKG